MKESKIRHIRNQNVSQVKASLLQFPERYERYTSLANTGVWACEYAGEQEGELLFRLREKGYGPPVGKFSEEAPFVKVTLLEHQDGTEICFSYRWQFWKTAFTILIGVLAVAIFWLLFCLAVGTMNPWFFVLLSVWFFVQGVGLYSLITMKRHDALIVRVFCELLDANFPCLEAETD